MTNRKNVFMPLTPSEQNQFLKPYFQSYDAILKHFKSGEVLFTLFYDTVDNTVHKMMAVGKQKKYSEDLHDVFYNKLTQAKYLDQIGSCAAEVMGLEFISLEEIFKYGLKAARIGADGKFSEIRKGDIRNKHLYAFMPIECRDKECIDDFFKEANLEINEKDNIESFTKDLIEVSKNEQQFNFIKSYDIDKVSRSLYMYILVLAGNIIKQMEILKKNNGNVVFRLDGRLRYYHPDKGADAVFTGSDDDSENSFETDVMWRIEGGYVQCLETICAKSGLKQEFMVKTIETMLNNPTSKLNEIFMSGLLELFEPEPCFADRYAIVNGCTIEFLKCKAGETPLSVRNITPAK